MVTASEMNSDESRDELRMWPGLAKVLDPCKWLCSWPVITAPVTPMLIPDHRFNIQDSRLYFSIYENDKVTLIGIWTSVASLREIYAYAMNYSKCDKL